MSVFLSVLVFAAVLLSAPGVMAAGPEPVTPEEGKKMVQQQKDLVVLDVRNPNEYVAAHYPEALNIPVNELETRFSEIPSGKPVLAYCARGVRSARACEILKEKRPDIKELYFINGAPIFE